MSLSEAQTAFLAKLLQAEKAGFILSELLFGWPQGVEWGSRVRGEFVLVTANRRELLDESVTSMRKGGEDLLLANAYELIDFAVTVWDRQTTTVAGGTKNLVRVGHEGPAPATVLVRKTAEGPRVSVEYAHRLTNQVQFLCIRPTA